MGATGTAWLAAVDQAPVGVLAYRARNGRPVACAVTPYVHDGEVVVTATLAFPAKAVAVHREGRAALLAGGHLLGGPVRVHVDPTGADFDRWLRPQELRKYPPARSLLAVPGHRRLFRWYVGRAYLRFVDPTVTAAADDATSLTVLDPDGLPAIGTATTVDAPDGPACVLVHHEDDRMADLRQLRVDGVIAAGNFTATRVVGSLDPRPTGRRADLAQLRRLARRARAARPLVATLPIREPAHDHLDRP